MKLAAIHLSRVTLLLEINDLIPYGKTFAPHLMSGIAERCQFMKFPKDFGKENQPSGVVFEIGVLDGQPISKLTIFNDGIVMETGSETGDTQAALFGLLAWAREAFGIHFEPEMVRRKLFYSQVALYLDIQLDLLNPLCGDVVSTLSAAATQQYSQPFTFRASGITFSTSTLAGKFIPGICSVERRVDVPDSENKYLCSAPLSTKDHLSLMERFEKHFRK